MDSTLPCGDVALSTGTAPGRGAGGGGMDTGPQSSLLIGILNRGRSFKVSLPQNGYFIKLQPPRARNFVNAYQRVWIHIISVLHALYSELNTTETHCAMRQGMLDTATSAKHINWPHPLHFFPNVVCRSLSLSWPQTHERHL